MASANSLSAEAWVRETVAPESYSDFAHKNSHVVSWAAILAGAIAAAALSLILLMLGAGLGLSSVSPWSRAGISSTSFGVSTIIWIAVTQILASGMGGYLAGRLRTKWTGVHSDETYFRDTAHGFMAWAVATLATAALLTSAIGTLVTGTAVAGAGVATAAMEKSRPVDGSEPAPIGYFIDALFRQDAGRASAAKAAATDVAQNAASSSEVTRIFNNSMRAGVLPEADVSYVGQLVAQRTGLKEAADKLRKATIYATLWLFVSLLMGAFSASLTATWGGRSRDV